MKSADLWIYSQQQFFCHNDASAVDQKCFSLLPLPSFLFWSTVLDLLSFEQDSMIIFCAAEFHMKFWQSSNEKCP